MLEGAVLPAEALARQVGRLAAARGAAAGLVTDRRPFL
jgi:hypothetical protein